MFHTLSYNDNVIFFCDETLQFHVSLFTESSVLYSTEYSIRDYAASVGGKYCGSYTPRTLTATQRYVYLYFKHPKGLTYSKRGFAVGHLSYSKYSIHKLKCVE